RRGGRAPRPRVVRPPVRLASGRQLGAATPPPFQQAGSPSAHAGVLLVTAEMRQRVRALDAGHHVHGTTDSEWLAALVTGEVAAHGGNLRAGVVSALSWTIAHVPVYSVNLLVMTDTELIAVRLPATNELWVLERAATAEA